MIENNIKQTKRKIYNTCVIYIKWETDKYVNSLVANMCIVKVHVLVILQLMYYM